MRQAGRIVALLVLMPSLAAADDLLGPAEYMQILSDSKIRYNILAEPSKHPVTVMDCARRDLSLRVVPKGKERALVEWSMTPEAKKLMDDGEVLYQAGKMAEAGEKFRAAIQGDPQAAAAYFSYGDTLLFGAGDAAAALVEYEKGIALDPTVPLGYLFASTALVRLNRADDAREQIIRALTYHPPYDVVWQLGAAKPERWNAKPIVRHKFEPPAGFLGGDPKSGVDIYGGRNFEWGGYAMCKAVWANEERFAKQHQADGGWSLDEERGCVFSQVMAVYNSTHAKLEEDRRARGEEMPRISEAEVVAALPTLEGHLFAVAEAGLLDGYILFEIIGQHCPLAMSLLDEENLRQVEAYIRRYVIVAAK